jgi:predicted dehydrogenase
MSNAKVRWGLIGPGRIAHTFAQDITATDNAELVAVAARDGARARSFADQYGLQHAHEGYSALYENPAVDAVYVATPHSYHLQHCTDAMQHGKAVLCEKPLVISPAQCRQLIAIAQDTGSYLMEGMWTWYLPAVRRALAWLEQGRIGELLHVKSDFGYPMEYSEDLREYDARVGGGAVLEMGIYPVAAARLFTGRSPHTIQVTGRRAANGVEDDVTAIFDYGNCMATLGTSFRCKLHNWTYIVGTEGLITIPDFWRAERCSLYHLDQRIDHFEDGRSSVGFDYQIGQVSQDILDGKTQSGIIPLATSLSLQEDLWAIREAIPRHNEDPG